MGRFPAAATTLLDSSGGFSDDSLLRRLASHGSAAIYAALQFTFAVAVHGAGRGTDPSAFGYRRAVTRLLWRSGLLPGCNGFRANGTAAVRGTTFADAQALGVGETGLGTNLHRQRRRTGARFLHERLISVLSKRDR